MLCEPFLNLRARHHKQPIRQLSKSLKFLRRTAHRFPMITLVCVFLTLATSSRLEASQPEPRPRVDTQETGSTNPQPATPQRGSDYLPVVVEVKPRPQTSAEAANEKKTEQQNASDRQWVRGVGIGTIVIALLQAWVLIRQAGISDRQRELTASQNTIMESHSIIMDGQLRETAKTAMAARDAVEHSQQSMHLDQRAWVGVTHADVVSYVRDKPIKITVTITNVGRTPALELRARIRGAAFESSETFVPIYHTVDESSGVAVLMPQQITGYEITSKAPLHVNERDAVFNGGGTYYLWGDFRYNDIFNYPHVTTFCFKMRRDLQAFTSCDSYNNAT
jgi:uncharacterized protein YecT (DUF1311 family)